MRSDYLMGVPAGGRPTGAVSALRWAPALVVLILLVLAGVAAAYLIGQDSGRRSQREKASPVHTPSPPPPQAAATASAAKAAAAATAAAAAAAADTARIRQAGEVPPKSAASKGH